MLIICPSNKADKVLYFVLFPTGLTLISSQRMKINLFLHKSHEDCIEKVQIARIIEKNGVKCNLLASHIQHRFVLTFSDTRGEASHLACLSRALPDEREVDAQRVYYVMSSPCLSKN